MNKWNPDQILTNFIYLEFNNSAIKIKYYNSSVNQNEACYMYLATVDS